MRCFCSSVPSVIRVGPTLLSVSSGSGTPAQCDSSTKIIWSIGPRACPPYSIGPTEAEPAVLAHATDVAGVVGLVRRRSARTSSTSPTKYERSSTLERLLFCGQRQMHRILLDRAR